MRAWLRRACSLISVLCTTAVLIMLWIVAPEDVMVWTGLAGVVTGAIAWRLDDRVRPEPPAL